MWNKILTKLKIKTVRAGIIVAIITIITALGYQHPDTVQTILNALSSIIDLFG